MVVRKETQQTGVIVNQPSPRRCAMYRIAGTFAAIVIVAAFMLLGLLSTPAAAADEQQDNASSDQVTEHDNGVTMAINRLTAVVTEDSGLDVQVTITNNTTQRLDQAHFTVLSNLTHTFMSRTDMQQWSEGTSGIPCPQELGSEEVASIDSGKSTTVSMHVSKDNDVLSGLTSWGPRPLALRYTADGIQPVVSHTFLTRSWEGLSTTRTPQLNMTVAMALTGNNWALDKDAMHQLLTKRATSATNPASTVTLRQNAQQQVEEKDKLAQKYPSLQIIADPAVERTLSTPHQAGLMQTGAFDITAYAQINEPSLYTSAGVSKHSWSAQTGQDIWRSVIADDNATTEAYAWQGNGLWTYSALAEAKSQGYETVIATHGFDTADDGTVHTAVYHVPTDNGEVTVLSAQPVLTSLASGDATSNQADAETTVAGRTARFIAQSAFYQMEQPYMDRSILVGITPSASAEDAEGILAALKDAGWLNITSLDTLQQADPFASDLNAVALLPSTYDDSLVNTTAVIAALESLHESRSDVTRFTSAILDTSSSNDAAPEPKDTLTAKQWGRCLQQAHDLMAILALDGTDAMRTAMVGAASEFSRTLLDAVTITSSNSINVVSETATMPVTVSNSLPYPVDVKVSSITDSMEIVTSRFASTVVRANGEAQVTLKIRVSTAGTTTAREQLLDRNNQPFSTTKYTTITSALQISDKSGLIFIAVAVVLGLLGLWRQFHRKKDPDE